MDPMEKLIEQAENIEKKLGELADQRAEDEKQTADLADQIKELAAEQLKLGKRCWNSSRIPRPSPQARKSP